MHRLPSTLVALLLAFTPTLVGAQAQSPTPSKFNELAPFHPPLALSQNQTTPLADLQFYHIRIIVTPVSSTDEIDPVCCLRPLPKPPDHQASAQEFLSFEEWKEKQRMLAPPVVVEDNSRQGFHTSPDLSPQQLDNNNANNSNDKKVHSLTPQELVPPALPPYLPPLTDRFNYASGDCSSRIHSSGPASTSSAGHILSSKKDKYMLSPCSAKNKYVIVELCDDIRIDTVQLANFEFFSGVFKQVRIRAAMNYPGSGDEEEGWTEMGTFEAKNIRAVQTFRPQNFRPFFRYIRIDFLSHYGSEYYCPVSLLRVYGLTQMEEWKQEEWEKEWRAKKEKLQQSVPIPDPVGSESTSIPSEQGKETPGTPVQETAVKKVEEKVDADTPRISENAAQHSAKTDGTPVVQAVNSTPTQSKSKVVQESIPSSLTSKQELAPTKQAGSSLSGPKTDETEMPRTPVPDPVATVARSPDKLAETDAQTQSHRQAAQDPTTTPPSSPSSNPIVEATVSDTQSQVPAASVPPNQPSSQASQLSTSAQSTQQQPQQPQQQGGESVFRTIANRIAVLENNSTLYMQYVEEQTRSVRETIRVLEEDLGRLEGISKSQQSSFNRIFNELVKQKNELEIERLELLKKVNDLASEVTLEKRLGIAQLILLVTVLAFIALNRSSSVGVGVQMIRRLGNHRQRVASLSGEWGSYLRGGIMRGRSDAGTDSERDRDRKISTASSFNGIPQDLQLGSNVDTPTHNLSPEQNQPMSAPPMPDSGSNGQNSKGFPISSASRLHSPIPTPVLLRHRPRMLQRSSSQNDSRMMMALSASTPLPLTPTALITPRRLAKTAHLHEVKRKKDKPMLSNLTNYYTSSQHPQTAGASSANSNSKAWRRTSSRRQSLNQFGGRLPPQSAVEKPSHWNTFHHPRMPTPILDSESENDGWVDTDDGGEMSNTGEPWQQSAQGQEVEFQPAELNTASPPVSLSSPPPKRNRGRSSSEQVAPLPSELAQMQVHS